MKLYGVIFFAGLFALFHGTFLQAKENPLLQSVPADTVFFSGNTQLINMADFPLMSFSPSFDAPLSHNERDALGRELAFFYELFLDLDATLEQGNLALQTHYGLAKDLAVAIYTVGVTPVIKLTVDNEQAFLDVLNKAEQKSGFKHRLNRFANLQYRAYPMSDQQQMVVHIQTSDDGKKVATIALLSNTLADKQKKLIFGLIQPEQSIADTGKVNAIQKDNQYLPLSVSFLDFRALVKSLFQVKNNPWVELLGDDEQVIANLQASGCEADVMAVAQEMPQIIAGYKKYQVQGQRIIMDFDALLELKNHNVKTELHKFRGFIPDYIRKGAKDNILAFGLGANLSQLTPMFFYISKAFRESTFQCEQFKKMQQDVAKVNPAMLALMTGVVDGVQGVSFAIQEFNLSQQETANVPVKEGKSRDEIKTDARSLSLLISLAAENPLKVWQMLTAFNPDFTKDGALIVPSDTPQKLNLTELDGFGLDVFVVLKGQHLVLYSGKKAATISNTLMNEKIVSNGFFQGTLNHTKLTSAVEELRNYLVSPASGQNLPAEACIYFDESIAMLSRFSGFVDFRSDFVASGWRSVVNADIELSTPVKAEYNLPGKYETYLVQDGCQLGKDGLEELHEDGTGFYQQYSQDGQCFIFQTRYRWAQKGEQLELQYVSEHSRPEGVCANDFEPWSVPEAEYVNDVCQLRKQDDGNFACLYKWDGTLNKSVYKRL